MRNVLKIAMVLAMGTSGSIQANYLDFMSEHDHYKQGLESVTKKDFDHWKMKEKKAPKKAPVDQKGIRPPENRGPLDYYEFADEDKMGPLHAVKDKRVRVLKTDPNPLDGAISSEMGFNIAFLMWHLEEQKNVTVPTRTKDLW